ncbi:MarR family transcriptional regulator [Lacrimispora amygdalina]|uniref:MarR family transcriptional regulator n=1 Tax=Lacrimispora amygdalina TaxID=253257 RepID=A0A3E2N9E8_9FIRM|nr:helix-turn-helix domain-containing protein [Clostridium indicum]RFZ77639.1 MarR family transcriptional regulator [Clostridium indicum]
MSEYQLQIKQIVDYPRCRIYRQFIQSLINDRSIRISGGSGLFYFTALCSYANFRTSYRRIDGISYTVYPGEWVCTLKELSEWFRTRFQCKALEILEELQKQHLISFLALGRGKVIKYKIRGWQTHNTVLEYNAPCQKNTGFFFLPVSLATELISTSRCSEMDIVLDLWLSAIYNDPQVQGSEIGPVIYLRNGTGNPLVTYSELGSRWGLSKATVGRVLKKLSDAGYLSLMTFPGRHGSVIYLQSYLSTMFQISDVMIDKEEVAMVLNIKLELPEDEKAAGLEPTAEHEVYVSEGLDSVSKSHIQMILNKMEKILMVQGISCFGCSKSTYKLFPLSNACGEMYLPRAQDASTSRMGLTILCGTDKPVTTFELTLSPSRENSIRRAK